MSEDRNQRFLDIITLLMEAKTLWDECDDDRKTIFEQMKWEDGLNWCVNAIQFVSGAHEALPYPERSDHHEASSASRAMLRYLQDVKNKGARDVQ